MKGENNNDVPHGYDQFIPLSLFYKAQEVLQGHNKKPFKYAGKEFNYRGLISCAKCGKRITPEEKWKRLKDGTMKKHVYYHCTQSKGKHSAPWITDEDLTSQYADLFDRMQMPEDDLKKLVSDLQEINESRLAYTKTITSKMTYSPPPSGRGI